MILNPALLCSFMSACYLALISEIENAGGCIQASLGLGLYGCFLAFATSEIAVENLIGFCYCGYKIASSS